MGPIPAQLQRFVASDRSALRIYLGFFGLTLVAGLALAAWGFAAGSTDNDGLFLKLGGVLVASLGSFPLKEYISLRSRITALLNVQALWNDYSALPDPPQAELDRLRELVWKLYEKRTLS